MNASAIQRSDPVPPKVQADLSRLRDATGRVVGSVFYGTMLKMMRESPFKGEFGHGGRGEEAFAGQLHGIWAEQMGTASTRGLNDVLFRHLAKQQERISRTQDG